MSCRLILALAVAVLGNVLFAQAPTKSPDNSDKANKPAGNCSVSGRVVSAADGTPLRSARVGLIQANERKHFQAYAATTDDRGHFELKQIEAGRYQFFASHIGYLEQQYQAKVPGEDEGAMLSLASGQEISDVLFRLVRAGVITGKVLDPSGEPMMGVTVSVLRKPTAEELEDAEPGARKQKLVSTSAGLTDDRGEYRIFGLKPGDYYVKAAESGETRYFPGQMENWNDVVLVRELGSQYAPLFYPGVLQMDQAQAIPLGAGQEMLADFAMRRIKLTEVSGHVIGADGSPATRAHVDLSVPNVESDWGGELGAFVDNNGEFSIKGVPPGSYVLSVWQNDQGRQYFARQKVEVGEGKIDSIAIALGRGAKLRGRVIATGGGTVALDRSQVVLGSTSEDETGIGGFAEVKKDGTFELDGVADGSYTLMNGGLGQGWFVKSAHVGNQDVFQNGVQVENGAAVGSLEIVIGSDGAQLEGTVTDSDKNQPLVGVQVKVRADPPTQYNLFRLREASTDQNGHYELKYVPPGKYKVSAKIPSSGGGAPAIKSDPVAVTLGDREHRALDIKLTIPKSE